ncbi:hypothetical protein SWVG_00034 [Synechococcus phage S-RIP1]|jgi:hypothetical protein|uniref:Uncharacterized protein n=1 Tax=Synechococcus phage S-RIP1 TaxID=754041 RepID=M4NUZ0_9CAUD|nr:hypothetical protein SWVG_00034 [Synechococcus phage S-RIP1]AGG91274.1 hypothetical protein SWVG_00034 [Synechococcus phage S-RIP1]
MSIISIEQFEELKEDYPDLAVCYTIPDGYVATLGDVPTGWDNFEMDWEAHA